MMKDSYLLDDVAKLASGAMGSVMEAGREMERMVRAQVEKLLARMDLVTREEFDTVQAMLAKAREEQENMLARIERLERHIAGLEGDKGL